ncbi:MAG: transcription elongation factor GreA [Thermogutta sp.]|nr:transcription elongation factor GreA [Thermogutta sp.]HOP77242.1 transcription elongation factor GreA [Thermogutta sp.]HPU07825.1 transcription elongation factor GreA [Thermogutta sp.]HQF14743.1 transcription elongation factor GreA [Thermogutta sp.]
MDERIPVTQAGYEKLCRELRELEDQLAEVTKRVAAAREEGDLRENAEYHGARETQGLVMAKINYLRDKIARCEIVDPSRIPRDRVALGCTVTVRDLDKGFVERYTLVGVGEEDYDLDRIPVNSPLAKGLLGKRVGEIAEVDVPAGLRRLEIVELAYDDESVMGG